MPNNTMDDFNPSGGWTSGSSGNEEDISIDEAMLRNKIVQTALSWVGTLEGSEGHAQIISIYNSEGPYPISMGEPWCAAFASAVAIQCGMESIVPITKSCGNMVAGFQVKGEWVENDAYHPTPGDYIFYIWDVGSDTVENQEGPDHVGIVVSVGKDYFDVVEGNKLGHSYDTPPNVDRVGVRRVYFNSSIIRGFGTPNYGKVTDDGVELSYEPVAYSPPKTANWEQWITEGQRNWLRRYRLEAGPEGEPIGFALGEFNGPNNPPLRIQFNVEKGDFETQNNSTIKIWNLGQKHRDVLSTPGCYVKLFAGYGASLPIITCGIVARAIDSFDGGNLVTELELVDIRRVIRDTYVTIPVQNNITGKEIIDKITTEMGLNPNSDLRYAEGLTWREYPKFAYVGVALKGIERVCMDNGYLCTILNGMIDIHRPGQVTSPRAIVLSAETGLIGNPKKLIETVNATYYLRGWQVEFMMNGAIDLGTLIRLESPFVPGGHGYYDVIELHITGDSMGDEWKCSAKLSDPYFGDVPIFEPKNYGISSNNTSGSGNFITN